MNPKKVLIAMSGGVDSAVAAHQMESHGYTCVGATMQLYCDPNKASTDIADARAVCEYLHIQNYTINIKYTTASFIEDIERNSDLLPNAAVYTNMPARVRMITLYNIAAMIGGRVINTGNKSEAFVGYTTKYGDLAGDYAILRDYYVTEVYKIGEALNLPEYLVHKAPADGMSGKTDADNMGFSYEVLDDYLMNGIVPNADILKNILDRHTRNRHKEAIRLPHPECRSRPYLSGTARQKYANDEDCPFTF